MGEGVRDVGEKGLPGADPARDGEGFFDRKMRRVPLVLERIEDEQVQALEQFETRGRDEIRVGAVGDVADAETQDRHVAVKEWDGRPNLAGDFERAVDDLPLEVGAEDFHLRFGLFERVAETSRQDGVRRGIRPDIQRAFFERIKSADIVKTHDVIGMSMGKDDGVDHVDGISDALQAKFRGGVDQNPGIAAGNDCGRTHALVVDIGAGTDRAMASNHRDAGGGAGAEKDDFYSLLLLLVHRLALYGAGGLVGNDVYLGDRVNRSFIQ